MSFETFFELAELGIHWIDKSNFMFLTSQSRKKTEKNRLRRNYKECCNSVRNSMPRLRTQNSVLWLCYKSARVHQKWLENREYRVLPAFPSKLACMSVQERCSLINSTLGRGGVLLRDVVPRHADQSPFVRPQMQEIWCRARGEDIFSWFFHHFAWFLRHFLTRNQWILR